MQIANRTMNIPTVNVSRTQNRISGSKNISMGRSLIILLKKLKRLKRIAAQVHFRTCGISKLPRKVTDI